MVSTNINGEKKDFRSFLPMVRIPVQPDVDMKINANLKNLGDKYIYGRLICKGTPIEDAQTGADEGIKINVVYKNKNGELINPETLKQGEDFTAEIEVKNKGGRDRIENLALTTIFPSGWEIINNRLNDVPSGEEVKRNRIRYQDIRDDRVYSYFNLRIDPVYNSIKVKVQLNAAYVGEFYMPAISCEAMYDNTIYARVPGKWVKVEK